MSREGFSADKTILERIIHKVPGNPIQSKKEKQGYVNLSEKNKIELLELIERQNKLLKNKVFLSKLPDKGERILNYKNQLEDELKKQEKSEELSNMLHKLNINGKEAVDKLEWTGNCNPGLSKSNDVVYVNNGIEFEEIDPLKIIATHSGTGFHKKITRVLPPEPSLIKPSDIKDIEDDKHEEDSLGCLKYHNNTNKTNEPLIEEPYIKNLFDKFEKLENNKANVKERFLPHKTINKSVEEFLKKSIEKTKNPNWEVTAATPPPSIYDTKLLTLETSVKLQMQQAEKLKEIQMEHATERLKSLVGKGIGFRELDKLSKIEFRDPQKHYDSDTSSNEDDENSFHSCHEEEEDANEKIGGITFYNLIDN